MNTIEGNKLIWVFMGRKWQPAERVGQNGMKLYEPTHETFEQCQIACNEINRNKSGSPRKLEYATPVPVMNSINRDLKYHSSWDWLMPVVQKIESFEFTVIIFSGCCDIEAKSDNQNFETIQNGGGQPKINSTWQSCIAFIRWYNKQVKQ